MRFWDASAVVPLLLEQPASARARTLLAEDPAVVIWWGTPVECASALARLRRDGHLSTADEAAANARAEAYRLGWYEMLPGDSLRAQALRVLRLHPVRAADALQLAAALEWSGTPASGSMVTFDERLAEAATREGLAVERLSPDT
jgi:uncharacterized protein